MDEREVPDAIAAICKASSFLFMSMLVPLGGMCLPELTHIPNA